MRDKQTIICGVRYAVKHSIDIEWIRVWLAEEQRTEFLPYAERLYSRLQARLNRSK